MRSEQAAMLADPEATLQRQRLEAQQTRQVPGGQGAPASTPGNTAAERQIALQQIAAETRNEARRETCEANEAERRGIDKAAESIAGHPYRSEQEARTAQQAARSVTANPNRPMQTEAGQSQKVQQLSTEQQRVLDNERRAQVEQQVREQSAARRAQNKDQDRDR